MASASRAALLRGGAGSAVVQASTCALMLIFSILLARFLGTAGYGIYAYAFALLSLLSLIGEAGVPTLSMREVARTPQQRQFELLRGALIRRTQYVSLMSGVVLLAGAGVLYAQREALERQELQTFALMLLVLPVLSLGKTVAVLAPHFAKQFSAGELPAMRRHFSPFVAAYQRGNTAGRRRLRRIRRTVDQIRFRRGLCRCSTAAGHSCLRLLCQRVVWPGRPAAANDRRGISGCALPVGQRNPERGAENSADTALRHCWRCDRDGANRRRLPCGAAVVCMADAAMLNGCRNSRGNGGTQ